MEWILKSFDSLTTTELYAILKLRCMVFVVEQECPYLDEDDKDQASHHLMGYNDGNLLAYSRILPAGISFAEPSIGRVVTAPAARKFGFGKLLMEKALAETRKLHGNVPIRIGAQLYLFNFYSALGFSKVSDIYLEDGIEHIEMLTGN